MPDRTPAGPTPPGSSTGPGSTTARGSWVVPLTTFVVGVLVGAIGTGLGRDAGDVAGPDGVAASPAATPPATTPAPTTSPGPDAAVTIPGACLQVADTGERLAALVTDAAEAAGRLDASALSGIVREMGEVQPGLVAQSRDCRAAGSPQATTAP